MTHTSNSAKFIATVFDFSTKGLPTDGTCAFTMEWKRVNDDKAGGKFKWISPPLTNDDSLNDDMKEALAAHLMTVYPGENIKPRHIVGLKL